MDRKRQEERGVGQEVQQGGKGEEVREKVRVGRGQKRKQGRDT